MICKTKEQAVRIANYGADKMDDQGYTYQHTFSDFYTVTKPGQTPYVVDTNTELLGSVPGGKNCTCAFAEENRKHQVCKHSVWIERKIDEQRILELEAEQADWNEYGKYDQMMGKF